jgi:hypothetical protein
VKKDWKHYLTPGWWKRPDDEIIVNMPVTIMIGGCSPGRGKRKQPKPFEVREPSNAVLQKQLGTLLAAAGDMVDDNSGFIKQIWEHPEQFTVAEIGRFRPMIDALTDLVASIVGESVEFVKHEMSPRQTTEVLTAYSRAVGLEVIRDCFMGARGEWNKIMAGIQPRMNPETEPDISPGQFQN